MFREDLMTALKAAVQNHNSGMSDNDAVVKSAADAGFNTDQTQRLIETYNTAKTLSMFKTADDRTVQFSTADPAAVMAELFDGSKMAAERKSAAADGAPYAYDYSEYDRPDADPDLMKAAGDDDLYGVKPADRPTASLDNLARAAFNQISAVKGTATKCASDAAEIREHYRGILTKIARFMTQDLGDEDRTPQALAWMKAAYPEQADPVISDIRAYLPASHCEKQAADVTISTFDMDYPEAAQDLADAVESKQAYAELKACELTFNDMATEWEEEFYKAADLFQPDSDEEAAWADDLLGEFQTKQAKQSYERISTWDALAGTPPEEAKKVKVDHGDLGDLFGLTTQPVAKGLGEAVTSAIPEVMGRGAKKEQKKHLDRVRNFQRQVLLEDLLSTDPILSGIDPSNALRAYETVVQIAPEYSLNKEVVRSILRTATNAEAMSPYDAKQLADLEYTARKILSLQQGKRQIADDRSR